MSTSEQLTSTLLMVEPRDFTLNQETLENNGFQQSQTLQEFDPQTIATLAQQEFWSLVTILRENGVKVVVCPSRPDILTPDSLFPNNWISFHHGQIITYPMFAKNRRAERQTTEVLAALRQQAVITGQVAHLDLTSYEQQALFLEGTGSLVLDRVHQHAYGCLSPRTSPEVVAVFCQKMGYQSTLFHAVDKHDQAIYHTNVLMSIGQGWAAICLESIHDPQERKNVYQALVKDGLEIIELSLDQLYSFCGNILQVKNSHGQPKIIMSDTAFTHFTPEQIQKLKLQGDVIHVDISMIEKCGGGGVRCMIAEVFT